MNAKVIEPVDWMECFLSNHEMEKRAGIEFAWMAKNPGKTPPNAWMCPKHLRPRRPPEPVSRETKEKT